MDRSIKKVLLLNPPGDKFYLRENYCSSVTKGDFCIPPVDLLVLSGILSKHFEVEVIDAIIEGLSESSCLERIKSSQCDAIIFLTGSVSWKHDFKFMEKVRGLCGAFTAASGGFLLFEGKRYMKAYPFLDAVLLDYTSSDIVHLLLSKDYPTKDVIYRLNGSVAPVNHKWPKSEFELPTARHELFPLDKYRFPHMTHHPFTKVLTSFSCPHNCSFCVFSSLDFRFRNLDNTLEELRYINKLGIKGLIFADQTFGVNKIRTIELCQRILNEGLDFRWYCTSRVDIMSDIELLKIIKKAGCHTIHFGVETGNDALMKRHSRGLTKEAVRQTFRLCREVGIETVAGFIIGLPGETWDTYRETVAFAKELKCDYAAFNVAVPMFGTRLREEAIEKSIISDKTDSFDPSGSPVFQTETLSLEELSIMRARAIKDFYSRPSYLLRRAMRIKSLSHLKVQARAGVSLIKQMLFS